MSNGTWAGWGSLGSAGGGFVTAPAALVQPSGNTVVIAVGTDGNLYLNWQNVSTEAWSGWGNLGEAGGGFTTPAMIEQHNGNTVRVEVGADKNVYFNWQKPDGTWAGWAALGDAGGGFISLVSISGQVTAGGSGLSGVTVTLTGNTAAGTNVSQTIITDSSGNYAFTVAEGGTYTVTLSSSTYTFNPPSQQFKNVSSNQTETPTVAQPAVCTTGVATVYGPDNSSNATFWYFGGAPGSSGYAISISLTINPPSASCVNPNIQWSTDSPSKLAILPSGGGMSATLTSLGASQYQRGFDIHVTVTYNGHASSPFPIFINTPYTMTTSQPGEYCENGFCGCAVQGLPYGYENFVTHGIADLNGKVLTPIVLNESLEKQQSLNSTYIDLLPNASTWNPSVWNYNTFTDVFSVCSTVNTQNPPVSSYNPSGGSPVFNETQKFWIGSGTHFSGVCVQRGVVTLYNNHGGIDPYYTPITNSADCAQGNTLN